MLLKEEWGTKRIVYLRVFPQGVGAMRYFDPEFRQELVRSGPQFKVSLTFGSSRKAGLVCSREVHLQYPRHCALGRVSGGAYSCSSQAALFLKAKKQVLRGAS